MALVLVSETPEVPSNVLGNGLLFLAGEPTHATTWDGLLATNGIRRVVRVTHDPIDDAARLTKHHRGDDFELLQVPVRDMEQVDIAKFFPAALAFIHAGVEAGIPTLVHCQAGVSRSATIVLAYLVAHRGMTLHDALLSLRRVRSVVSPNMGFMAQLAEFEVALISQQLEASGAATSPPDLKSTLDLDEYLVEKVAKRYRGVVSASEIAVLHGRGRARHFGKLCADTQAYAELESTNEKLRHLCMTCEVDRATLPDDVDVEAAAQQLCSMGGDCAVAE